MKKFLGTLLFIGATLNVSAVTHDEIRFHDEANDTTRITNMLIEAEKIETNFPGERLSFIAKKFLGIPYVAHTLEGEEELLTVNLDELDCTTFVETVLAMTYTVEEGRTSWRDYVFNLERMRYRKGNLNGYSSRLHYISDWIIDNSHRGNFVEATNRITQHGYVVKSIDFMSGHRSSYASLSDSAEYARIKEIESGYRNHRFPYIKKENLRKKEVITDLREGDVVALTTRIEGLDVSHLGIITFVDNVPHLMHASMKEMKVIIDPKPLYDYMMKNRGLTGIRVIRLNHN